MICAKVGKINFTNYKLNNTLSSKYRNDYLIKVANLHICFCLHDQMDYIVKVTKFKNYDLKDYRKFLRYYNKYYSYSNFEDSSRIWDG